MFNNKLQGMNQTPNVNFGLKDTQPVQCTDCKGEVFQNGVIFRKVSKILAGKMHWYLSIYHIVLIVWQHLMSCYRQS